MSRQIKFRAWNKSSNQMIDLYKVTPFALDKDLKQDGIFIPFSDQFVVEQWTGRVDSNNREIYEGDIVKWDDASSGKYWRVAKVIWNERGGWTFRTIPSQCIGSCVEYERDFNLTNFIYSLDPSKYENVLEIIGHVHENSTSDNLPAD